MNHLKYVSILIFAFSSSLFAQKIIPDFSKEIDSLNVLGQQIIGSESDAKKKLINREYTSVLKELISQPGSFDYQFMELKTISVLQAHQLKIYNWTVPFSDGTYAYFSFLQIKKNKNEFTILELSDQSDKIKSPENKVLTANNWYGALYYHLIHNKALGKNYYTLLGWDGNNNLTNKKIIDVIHISSNGSVKFGAPIFKTKKKTKKRMIFEYSENVVMSLKYHERIEKIVFDVLIPASSKLKGVYAYYGPSLEMFDALYIENNKWNYQNDIDIKLDPNLKDSFWKKPQNAIVR